MRQFFPASQVFRFAITGVLATATHYIVLRILVEIAGLKPALATAFAFCVAVLVTYIGQSRWVFQQKLSTAGGFGKFMATAVGGLLANVAIMYGAVDLLGQHYLVGFLTALFVVPTSTFIVSKLWVFTNPNP